VLRWHMFVSAPQRVQGSNNIEPKRKRPPRVKRPWRQAKGNMDRHSKCTKKRCTCFDCRDVTLEFLAELVSEDATFTFCDGQLFVICRHGKLGDADSYIEERLGSILDTANKGYLWCPGLALSIGSTIALQLRGRR